MNKVEILAPVGSEETLKAAVLSGADAVYFGMGDFNARRNAQNFTDEQMQNAIKYCHSRGVKVHITLNTLIKDCEIDAVIEAVKKICKFGADAIIIQDLGVAEIVHKVCPAIEMHASTQMTVGTLEGLHILKKIGFSRAVLPRELNFNEIKFLCEHSPIDLEVFVHGALCMCVSGQCLMSAQLGSRSGNRGLCAQPCRLPFKVQNGTGHDLSLKDLSLIEHINELSDMGICSFKIEGRMKRPEYVSASVKACKRSLEKNYDHSSKKDLQDLFSRSGFTDGYFNNQLGRNMFGYREKENVQATTKELLSKYAVNYEREEARFDVDFEFSGKLGEKATLYAKCNGHTISVESDVVCEVPINRPLQSERVIDALKKCGGTQFQCKNVKIANELDFSIPISVLNSMRRSALEKLEQAISMREGRVLSSPPIPTDIKSGNLKKIYCRFDNIEQIPKGLKTTIFVPLGSDEKIIEEMGYGVELPHGMFGNSEKVEELLKKSTAKTALCHTLDAVGIALKCGKRIVAAPSMNILNSISMDKLKKLGIYEAIVSNECTLEGFKAISSPIEKGLCVYGRQPLMLVRNCPVKNGKSCSDCKRQSVITDKMGIDFPVKCHMGFSEILNSRPLYMGDRMKEIPDSDILFFNFTTESQQEVKSVLLSYRNQEKPTGEFTRGLLYRGVN